MPKPTKGPRLGGSPAHERIILRNLASQLFEHGHVVTTLTKAKRVRPLAEKLINRAKTDTVANRRIVNRTITDRGVVHILFTEIGPLMEGRDGGYTRITRIGNRKGDNAPMAVIEIITEKVTPKAPASAADAKEQINSATESADAKDSEAKDGDAAIEDNTLAENAAAEAPVAAEQDAVEAGEKAEEKTEA
ncbi:50S ribosomal protein L17 [Cutibacterium equinum]|uniref:Large ribosomal subunit protein bL17 n=1 Tax=Cutibacterium equinum TaxID=3016342 RepID=A0ABY7QYH4_9ACTN|nr:50S ribosomal protein L17 [Cutibacterium equinum]WCC79499.1 50S ribosomal protein L17 [Cutibacterium equinum]